MEAQPRLRQTNSTGDETHNSSTNQKHRQLRDMNEAMSETRWDPDDDPVEAIRRAYFNDEEDHTTNVQLLRAAGVGGTDSVRLTALKSILDIIAFGLLPIVLIRLLKNLLSAAAFSSDIFDEIQLYVVESKIVRNSLLQKFSDLVFEEASWYVDTLSYSTALKSITVLLYLLYSVSMSGYIVFTCIFYFMCLTLTTMRRWGELHQFLLAVFKSRNGVM